MRFLRKNTAVIVTVGPFYDKTDGVTIETALTITNERITLTADTDDGSAPTNILDNIAGATAATANDLNYITGNDAGMMQMELAAADVNRLGRMFLSITDAANHVPVFHEFMVVNAALYDAFFATTGGAIPNAAADAAGGLPISDAGGLDLDAQKADVAAILVDTGTTLDGRIPAALTANGNMKSSLMEILATALTETAGQIAGAFKKFFDKAAPTGTVNSLADAVPGAAGGGFIAGANAATSVTTALTANITGNLSGSVGSVTGAVGSVTGSIGSLGVTAKSDVNAEVVDALNVDTYAEPGQELPAATNTLVKKIGYLFKAWRNKITQDGSTYKLYADDTTTVDQKATVTDDATTFTRGEVATGP